MEEVQHVDLGLTGLSLVFKEIVEMKEGARIYRTYVKESPELGSPPCVFMTKSKNLHLLLGLVNEYHQGTLSGVLKAQFERAGKGSMLLDIEHRSVLVTKSSDADERAVYVLSL